MNKEIDWSQESYRLDKVVDIFGLPCVVRLVNSVQLQDQSEKFAQGDIITINSEISFDKVASNFIHWDLGDRGVLTPDNSEVFLPHSYSGKLRVLKKISKVYTVKELANIFPGTAELGERLTIKTNEGESVTLAKGKIIELERVIPGFMHGVEKEPDELVIHFKHSKQNKVAAIPFNIERKFYTKVDPKIYTIKMAITRYGLPLDVKFTNDHMRQKFNQEVIAGRRTVGSVTSTLRLNRIVPQRVIVGHHIHTYIDCLRCTDIHRKTVMSIPIDTEDIGGISVNVCEGDVLSIFKSLIDDESANRAHDIVTESIRHDFAEKSEMKLFTSDRLRASYRDSPIPDNPDTSEDEDGYLIPGSYRLRETEHDDYIDMTWTSRKNNAHVPPLPPRRPIHTNKRVPFS